MTSTLTIQLNDITFSELDEYLEEYYCFEYLLTKGEGNTVIISTYSEGLKYINYLLQHYWSVDKHKLNKYFKIYNDYQN